ncbi:prephenate dehydratase [Segetibacter sp.]|jgi:prephenate dehydratase|uniref:prephenate dehydratase n=1 Tax=Segetibacter sp. TaxID=2231182 RepID=UPI00260D6005|nr:prephenate dehydratase [Segetibacter sp.]MCW3080932.1 Prephenate dehydratase [Segetibacter sp.]
MTAGQKESKAGVSSPLKVAIQGYEGSFHQEAARKFFGKNVEVIPCDNFRQVIKVASDPNKSNGGVMAIENSIAGSILPNYNLLQKSDLTIVGEKYLHIRQHLMVNPGVQLSDIKEVHSHPMALLQCIDFLEKHHSWKLVETDDTALSAKFIQRHKSKHTAAIASKLAAELYNLEMIAPDIHTLKNNYTRFLMVQRKEDAIAVEDADKASVYFETDHSKGSLAKVLTAIASNGVNMNKLQSMPIPGSDFLYGFYADMEIEDLEQFNKVVAEMQPLTAKLKVFGTYAKGNLK